MTCVLRALGKTWQGYDTVHCSAACLRATEENVGGHEDNYDPSLHFAQVLQGFDPDKSSVHAGP